MKLSTDRIKIILVILAAGVFPFLLGATADIFFGTTLFFHGNIHEYIEITGTSILFGVAFLLLFRLQYEDPAVHLMWVILALISMGLIDSVHAVLHFDVTWIWLQHIATLIGGILFALVWAPLSNKIIRQKFLLIFIFLLLSSAIILITYLNPYLLPVPAASGGYSFTVKAFNIIGGLGFVVSSAFFFRRYLIKPAREELAFGSLTLLLGASALMFGYSHLWTAGWWVLHGFRLAAYVIVLITAFQYVTLLLNFISDQLHELKIHTLTLEKENIKRLRAEDELKKNKEALELLVKERTDELARTNERLRQNIQEQIRINKELNNARRAALNLTEDALIARKNVEVLNEKLSNEISVRKAAEEEIKQAARQWQITFDSIPDLVSIQSKDLTLLNVNKAYAKTFGMKAEELIGRKCYEIVHHKDCPVKNCVHVATMKSGKTETQEIFEPLLNAVLEATTSPLFDENGEFLGTVHVAKDITERKLAEKRLQESEEQFRMLTEAMPQIVWSADETGNIDYYNQHAYDYAGLSKNDIDGWKWASVIHPADLKESLIKWREAISTGSLFTFEQRIRRADGEYRWHLTRGVSVHDSSGKIIRWIGTATDINDQKTAGEILERRVAEQTAEILKVNTYNRNLIEVSLDPLVTISADGKITDVNNATERATGIEREKLIGTDFSSYFTEPGKAMEGYLKVLSEGVVKDYPLTLRHISGKTTDVLYNASIYKNENGEVQGVFAAAHDITEMKKAEETIKLANAYNRNLLEVSLDPLVTISADGKITDANKAVELVTGVSRGELIGSSFSKYFTQPEKADEGYQRVLSEGYAIDYPLTIRHRNGTTTDVIYNATVYKNQEGKIQGVFAAARDVTGLRKAEEETQKYLMELKRSNTELEQFAYVASHDLQEPLRMVSSYTQLIAQRYQGRLDADADDFINFAVDGANRMQTLINSLLTYSRVGRSAKPFSQVDCHSVIGNVLVNLGASIEESGAIVTCDNLPIIYGDEMQLVQLFQNLIGNAIKFRNETKPLVHISALEKPNEWIFSIRDNGIGIEDQYFERIFIIFQRLNLRSEYSGTGMGLAICKKIVEKHGGRIWVKSRPGEGSIFYFTIPKVN